jgi:hypothetical protein
MDAKELTRLPDPRKNVHAEVREVVQDIHGKPHLFLRVRLTGWGFPHRAQEPFLAVGDVVSRRVVIDRDGLAANAYFDKQLPAATRVSFGYGNTINWDFDVAIEPRSIHRLDRTRLPEKTIDPFPTR